jgi:hypothetical protein
MSKRAAQSQLTLDDYFARSASTSTQEMKTAAELDEDVAAYLSASTSTPSAKTAAELEDDIDAYLHQAPSVATSSYEARQAARRARLERGSERSRDESQRAYGSAARTLGKIPMGQPILVGHHSEQRHRRDLAKADRAMRKSIEADKRSKQLAARAAAVGTGGVSSDDPEAVRKLRAELTKLKQDQENMKAANTAIRKHAKAGPPAQIEALTALSFAEQRARQLLEKDFAGRVGFPAWAIGNNSANIRRIEKRIAELTARAIAPERAPLSGEVDGMAFTLVENRGANRAQITFAGKPSNDVRARLKAAGFRWAPSQNAWQRLLSNAAWFHAKRALLVPDSVQARP